jgi:hypothetical protein
MGKLVTATCCGHTFSLADQWYPYLAKLEGCTFNCPNKACRSLQYFFNGDGDNAPFHEYKHAETWDSEFTWPVDGANTGSLEV